MARASGDSPASFQARVILLGASNVTRGVSTIVETAQTLLGAPLDVYAAIGHGRSFGLRSRVIIRDLPSILDSRLWEVVADQQPVPTYALIGDIGNDVMYGSAPASISAWINTCMERLAALEATTICTSLPLARIETLRNWQFLAARSLLFPMHRLTFDEAMRRAGEVMHRVEAAARARHVAFIELPAEWYGNDPIHIRQPKWAEAWGSILHHWVKATRPEMPLPRARGSFSRWLRIRSKSPEQWWLFGVRRGRWQPCITLQNGTRISLY